MFVLGFGADATAQSRRRVAVTTDAKVTGQDRNAVAVTLENALLEKLASNPAIEVIDRGHLQALFAEQNMSFSERIDPSDTAKIGKLKGVDVLVIVNVTDFAANASEDKSSRFVVQAITDRGTVHLSAGATVVLVERGSVISAPTATVDPPMVVLHTAKVMEDVNKPYIVRTPVVVYNEYRPQMAQLIEKAVNTAGSEIYEKLQKPLENAPITVASAPVAVVPAMVAGLFQGSVLVNQGSGNGFKVGQRFQVVRMVDTGVMDPRTKQTIHRRTKVCLLTLTEVDDGSSSGTCQGDAPKAEDVLVPESLK